MKAWKMALGGQVSGVGTDRNRGSARRMGSRWLLLSQEWGGVQRGARCREKEHRILGKDKEFNFRYVEKRCLLSIRTQPQLSGWGQRAGSVGRQSAGSAVPCHPKAWLWE